MKTEFRISNGRVLPPGQRNTETLEDAKKLEQEEKAYKSLGRSLRLIGYDLDRFSAIDNNERWDRSSDYPRYPSGLRKLIPGSMERYREKTEAWSQRQGRDFNGQTGHVVSTASNNSQWANVELRFDPEAKAVDGEGLALPTGIEEFHLSRSPENRPSHFINHVDHINISKDGGKETFEIGRTEFASSDNTVRWRDNATIVADHDKGLLTYEYHKTELS